MKSSILDRSPAPRAVGRSLSQLVTVGALGVWALSSCVKEKPAPPLPPPPAAATVCPPPPSDARALLPAATAAVGEAEAELSALARYYPGSDSARTPRTRKATAVLLFAPPGAKGSLVEAGLSSVDRLRFQPIVCTLRGKLAVGPRCGEAMPPRAKVRLTDAGGLSGIEELELERSPLPYMDTAGGHQFPAPYGPACCMYDTCIGKTVPYYPRESPADRFSQPVLTTTKTVLAVWPADAEIDLVAFAPGPSAEVNVDDGPWIKVAPAESPSRLVQTALLGTRRYASIAGRTRGLLQNVGSGWQLVLNELGVREYYLLSSSDLDGDGRPELLVYAQWANDYGLNLLANDAPRPLYGFSCGNI